MVENKTARQNSLDVEPEHNTLDVASLKMCIALIKI